MTPRATLSRVSVRVARSLAPSGRDASSGVSGPSAMKGGVRSKQARRKEDKPADHGDIHPPEMHVNSKCGPPSLRRRTVELAVTFIVVVAVRVAFAAKEL